MSIRHTLFLVPLAVALGACSDDTDHDFDARAEQREAAPAGPEVAFDPANGVLPFPNDVLFAGSEDGTLNIDVPEADDLSNPAVALNQMDGFSTVAPLSTGVGAALDPASLRIGETVRVFEYERDAQGAVTLGEELGPDRLVAVERDGTLAIVPLVPLSPSTSHAVYVTRGVSDPEGRPLGAPGAYAFVLGATPLSADDPAIVGFDEQLPLLEPLRLATRPLVEAAAAAQPPIAAGDIAVTWSVTTQSIREVLAAAKELATAAPLALTPTGRTTSLLPGGSGIADIYIGGLSLPYYLVDADSPDEFEAALNGFWRGEDGNVVTGRQPVPARQSVETVPVLMTVPNAASPGGATPPPSGWPVVMFQHGITGNRTNMFGIAESMASAGIATIAIDIPLHGLTDPADPLFGPLHADANPFVEGERTFDIDVVTGSGGSAVPGADGVVDSSGQHFVNLRNLANTRDNLRQTTADLMTLSASLDGAQVLAGVDVPPQPFPFDTGAKGFVGHSLGGIAGATFLSYDPSVRSATLAMPGGGIAGLLANSPTFGPDIRAGVTATLEGDLDAAAVEERFARFLVSAQTLIDSADPINHARFVDKSSTAVHMIEVIGAPPEFAPDQVVPNAVATAPLSGTEPLATALALEAAADSTSGSALVRFTRGDHSSILRPGAPEGADEATRSTAEAVTVEMQTQAAAFAGSGGQSLPIGNADVVAPVDATIVPLGAPDAAAAAAQGAR